MNMLTTLFGQTIDSTITIPGLTPQTASHTWTAGSDGLFHTGTDLKSEWQSLYDKMLGGQGGALSAIQRLEGNAEAVFENTGLKNLSVAQQKVDREDVQRAFDAMASAMKIDQQTFGIDPNAPFTKQSYLTLEHTLQGDPALQELAIQGHGLNNPPSERYDGYTNDFQNNVDNKTLYVGGGLNNGKAAIPDFFDDNVISHTAFPTVVHNGNLVQLNQNGNRENSLSSAVTALNRSAYYQVYVARDFVQPGGTTHGPVVRVNPKIDPAHPTASINDPGPGGSNTHTSIFGFNVSNTITSTPHEWVAGSDGLYHTSSNLAVEWKAIYQKMLSGEAGDLTPVQRLEGNAEAVFENTGLNKLSAAQQAIDREDVQREFDAMTVAMNIDASTLHIKATAPFTSASYIALEQTIASNPLLEELAIQGHGLNNASLARYNGYTNDFQNNVDNTTKYIGGGLNNGKKAIADFFDDNVLSHTPFPTVFHNGKLEQLNQNGNPENTETQAITALNESMFYRVYTSNDFKA